MSHLGHQQFHESLRENKLEKIYEVASLPKRCFTSYDAHDKAEVKWRLLNCYPVKEQVQKPTQVVLPSRSEDEDYWREREEVADNLREIYREAQLYRDL